MLSSHCSVVLHLADSSDTIIRQVALQPEAGALIGLETGGAHLGSLGDGVIHQRLHLLCKARHAHGPAVHLVGPPRPGAPSQCRPLRAHPAPDQGPDQSNDTRTHIGDRLDSSTLSPCHNGGLSKGSQTISAAAALLQNPIRSTAWPSLQGVGHWAQCPPAAVAGLWR